MTVIATTGTPHSTAYGNQRKVDRCQNGVLWAVRVQNGTNTDLGHAYYSTNNGATWADGGSIPGATTAANNNYNVNGSFFIDLDDYAHWVFKDNYYGYLYYRRGTPNAARTAWTWSAPLKIHGTTVTTFDYPDIIAHREGTGWSVHIVYSYTSGANNYTYRSRITIGSNQAITLTDSEQALGGNYFATPHTFPSIDFNHTGDGKTVAGGTPHLYSAWSAGKAGTASGIRFRKATYSGGAWTWGTEQTIDSARYVVNPDYWLNCLFDGTRVIIVGQVYDGAGTDLILHDRNAADTATFTRVLIENAATSNYLATGSASYDSNGNVYLLGRNSAPSWVDIDFFYRKWTRSTATLGAPVVYDNTLNTNPYISTKRGHSGQKLEFIYLEGSSAPYSVTYGGITLNTAPTAPTGLAPNAATIDKSITNRFSWTHNDPEGDAQGGYDLQYRKVGDTVWTTVSGSTVNQYRDIVGGTFTGGNWEWRVRTYDAPGLVGPYSAIATFEAKFNAPTNVSPIHGSTVNTDVPLLKATIESGRAEWQLATDSAFTANVRTAILPEANAITTAGEVSMTLPDAQQLFQGTWYIRARVYTTITADWSAANTFTVSHPPTTSGHAPTAGEYVAFGATGDVTLSWTFSDTSSVDAQTAYQILVERNVDGVLLVDTGKVLSAAGQHTVTIPASEKDVELRWRIRVWDSDDVVGPYSANHLFFVSDAPTVNIVSPAEASVVTTPRPTIDWDFAAGGTRTQARYMVTVTRTSVDQTVDYNSGWILGADTVHTLATNLENQIEYIVRVTVEDNQGFQSSDTNTFTTEWIKPFVPAAEVDLSFFEDDGFVRVTWEVGASDPNFYAWRVYRKLSADASWTLLLETQDVTVGLYDDYTPLAGQEYFYAVVQVKVLFGDQVESEYHPLAAKPVTTNYWLIDPLDKEKSFRIYHVISDSFSDEWEQQDINLIGRGRHVDFGDRWGYRGSIAVQLRDKPTATAREQRLQLEAWKAENRELWLRNPFGDYFPIIAGQMQFERESGVGLNEYSTVTIPYAEVIDEGLI